MATSTDRAAGAASFVPSGADPAALRRAAACLPWLRAELERVRPALVVCLGATAAKAVLGNDFKVSERRGEVEHVEDYDVIATVHPSVVLRAPDRQEAYEGFLADLRTVRARLDA